MARATVIVRDRKTREAAVLAVLSAPSDPPHEVTVAPAKKGRSAEQNRLYHKWIGIIASETGHDHEEIHEFCKAKFLAPVVVDLRGEMRTIHTTKRLKVGEMSEYMTAVQAWAATDLGIHLPVPEEMHMERMKR